MRNHAAQLAIIKQLSRQELHSTAGNCQAAEQAGITQHSWQLSSRWQAGIVQLSWQLSSRMNDGGTGWLVIILENSEASELSLPLPLALFSFSPLRGLFLICSFPFPTHTDRSWWLADCVCLELESLSQTAEIMFRDKDSAAVLKG